MTPDLIQTTPAGFYCPAGDFYIDPCRAVHRAVITHAHADHACPGCANYLSTPPSAMLLKARLGDRIRAQSLDYGKPLKFDGLNLSLHPAGHVLGSAQVRLEYGGQVWVLSGDFKIAPDPTCHPFEPLRCHTFIMESTFGLPIFQWPDQWEVVRDIESWWRTNQNEGRPSVLYAYALGKAQRVLAALDAAAGPIVAHAAVEKINRVYRQLGVRLAPTQAMEASDLPQNYGRALFVLPPDGHGPSWTGQPPGPAKAMASGWMLLKRHLRQRDMERGFVLSDHADWHDLLEAVNASQAEHIWLTHGESPELLRWLQASGRRTRTVNPTDRPPALSSH